MNTLQTKSVRSASSILVMPTILWVAMAAGGRSLPSQGLTLVSTTPLTPNASSTFTVLAPGTFGYEVGGFGHSLPISQMSVTLAAAPIDPAAQFQDLAVTAVTGANAWGTFSLAAPGTGHVDYATGAMALDFTVWVTTPGSPASRVQVTTSASLVAGTVLQLLDDGDLILEQSLAVAPAQFATAEASTSSNVWRAGLNRVQCFYDSSHWTSPGPVVINAVEFRLAGGLAPGNVVAYPNVEIYLQNAAVDFQSPSTTFSANRTVAFPTTPNFAGAVTTVPATGTTPNSYFITVPLMVPFTYDPSTGADLLMELVILADPAPLLGNTISCASNSSLHLANSVRSVGSTTALIGTQSPFCPLARFTFTEVPNAAVNTTLGAGCIASYASLYESFAVPSNFDLAHSAITFHPTGNGYVVVQGGSWLPVGSQAIPTQLVLGDDAEVSIALSTGSFPGWTGITVGSNGYVASGPGNTGATPIAAPTIATFLNAANPGFYCQLDLDPSAVGSGPILVEETPAVTVVTWNGVPNWDPIGGGGAAPCFLQMQLAANGQVTIAWHNFTTFTNNGGVLVGYSPGGASLDPGSADLSAITSVNLAAVDVPPLSLSGVTRPVIGTNWTMAVGNVPANAVLGVDVVGLADPGIGDLSFLGMPGCGLRASPDLVSVWLPPMPHSFSFAIPNNPSLVGLDLFATSAVFQAPPVNAFGAITSNGIKGTIGSN